MTAAADEREEHLNRVGSATYYDRRGTPIRLGTWSRLLDDREYRWVARSTTWNGYLVSTVWLGTDHRFGPGAPLVFETMVFDEACGGIGNGVHKVRYGTEAEALPPGLSD